jgi:uncharacterized membrane protein YfcA
MMLCIMEVFILILLLSIVQSLFGVGLLLFGTPLLLFLGYDYTQALFSLLPASAALSWSQVADLRKERLNGGYRQRFFLICLPALVLGMVAATRFDIKWEIRSFVTIMLFVAFALRTSLRLRSRLQAAIKSNLPIALAVMGLVHGLSNMGGSILTPLVSSLYKDKSKVLAGVSFDYAFMATLQILVLMLVSGKFLGAPEATGAAISLSVRYLLGKRVFAFASEESYQRLLSGFILANAFLLGINLL